MNAPPSMNDQFLQKINKSIEDNLNNEHFSVEELARDIGLSRSMLHRKLIKLSGKSATDLITEMRLSRAKELLENNVATASEIAYQVGFSSPSYFNKVFKKHFNISPGAVRKQNISSSTDHLSSVGQKREERIVKPSQKPRFLYRWLTIILVVVVAGSMAYNFLIRSRSMEQSIAVLPLHNLTGLEENAYFVDGMHDALIGELGQIASLRVISRQSTLRYRESDMPLKDIAKELDVNTILEGSVTMSGDSLRVLIQLIDVFPQERHILAKEYREDLKNILNVQASAAKDIVQKIDIKLSKNEAERLSKSRTVDPETYKAYLRGMYHLKQGTQESVEMGMNYLYEAIERDPGDPFAYAGLALGLSIAGHSQLTSEEQFQRATSAANKAIRLDPTIDEAHLSLALLYLYNAWDWSKAEESFENAIVNNPNSDIAHANYAWYHILFDDMDKSIYHAEKAVAIDPFSASYKAWLAMLYYHIKEYDKAEHWAREALAVKENVPYGNLTLGWVSLEREQYSQAIEYHEKLPDQGAYMKSLRGYCYVKAGQREKAMAIWYELEEMAKNSDDISGYRAMLAACLGFRNKAFELLNQACDNKLFPVNYINFYPCSEDIRDDPRYDELLKKMNLPTRRNLITKN